MSVLERLEKIRINEGLNKSEFEKRLGKSNGYIGSLKKSGGIPGSDVLLKVTEVFNNYNIEWVLTGNGNIKKDVNELNEEQSEYINHQKDIGKQIQDVSYLLNRRLDGIEEMLKHIALDSAATRAKADMVDLKKIKQAFDDLGALKGKVG
ncbi:helix-turn-helix domain-containing protein [Flavobacteriaceae bacterium TK19130]|nr:helix-turn-helix domain-containing protein [Thermobacterium salinum]